MKNIFKKIKSLVTGLKYDNTMGYETVAELPTATLGEPELLKQPDPFDLFLEATQNEMREKGVELYLKNTIHVRMPDEVGDLTGMPCSGWFTETPKLMFAVGMAKPFEQWALVYVHEFGHFTQWRDQIPEWQGVTIDGLYYDNFLNHWLERGLHFAPWKVDKFINAIIAVEADCERRAIKLIEEYELPFDTEEYAQKANAYVHFYNYIRENKKWYIAGKEPYHIPEVYSQFNTTIDDDFSTSWEYIDLYDKYCF